MKNNKLKIISVRNTPEFKDQIIQFFQENWSGVDPIIYEDCISNAITSTQPLPNWYVLIKQDEIIGGAGLITNDFISRMDLYPWLCALYIKESHRGNNYGSLLIEHIKNDSKELGFKELNLCTDHSNYYEKFGFVSIGIGYHPWGESSKIYQIKY